MNGAAIAIAVAAVAAALAGFAVVRARREGDRALERLRTRLASDLHDDLGSSLSRISILSEVARRQVGAANAETAKILGEISETARAVVEQLGDAVWSVDPRGDTMRHVVSRMRRFASDVLDGSGISWRLDAPDDVSSRRIGSEARRQLFLVFKEAVTNVVRHSGCKSATLRLAIEGSMATLEVADDGRGFESEPAHDLSSSLRRGRGLLSMQVRAGQMGGKLTVTSSPGEGVRLVLTLPLRAGDA